MSSRAMKGEYLLVYIDVHQQQHCLLTIILLDIYVSVLPKRSPFIGEASINSSAHYFQQPPQFSINQATDLLAALLILLRPIQEHNQGLQANPFSFAISILQKGLIALHLWIEADIFNPDQNYLKYLV
jgi:hypothetical protein